MTKINNAKTPVEQDIIEGLAISLNLSRELLSVLNEESAALRTMDTQGLFCLSRRKETLLAKIQYLDDSLRKSLAEPGNSPTAPDKRLQGAPEARKRPASNTPVREQAADPLAGYKTDGVPCDRLRLIGQYREKIKAMRVEIQARNMINKRFTEDTLGYLSDAIALITRPVQADLTYRIPGRSQYRGQTQPSFISRGV